MCLGVPGKIVEMYVTDGLKMGKIDFGGVQREACLEYVPEAQVGEYTVIHVGFAISRLSEEEAMASLEILRQIADLEEETRSDVPGVKA
jgi:hydrogenase expression/formation protein HypC